MIVLPNWIVLSSTVHQLPDGRWFAAMTVKVPNQGGYDRAPSDDVMRLDFKEAEEARAWLKGKMEGLVKDESYVHTGCTP